MELNEIKAKLRTLKGELQEAAARQERAQTIAHEIRGNTDPERVAAIAGHLDDAVAQLVGKGEYTHAEIYAGLTMVLGIRVAQLVKGDDRFTDEEKPGMASALLDGLSLVVQSQNDPAQAYLRGELEQEATANG